MRSIFDNQKWQDPWFLGLSGTAKLVAIYAHDHGDRAGFWPCDFAAAEHDIRPELPIDWPRVYREMNTQREGLGQDVSDFKQVHRAGYHWWFPGFIRFRHGSGVLFSSLRRHGMVATFHRLYPGIDIPSLGPEPMDCPETEPPPEPKAMRIWRAQQHIEKLRAAISEMQQRIADCERGILELTP